MEGHGQGLKLGSRASESADGPCLCLGGDQLPTCLASNPHLTPLPDWVREQA